MWIGNAYFGGWKDLTTVVVIGLAELFWVGFIVWQIYNNFLAN